MLIIVIINGKEVMRKSNTIRQIGFFCCLSRFQSKQIKFQYYAVDDGVISMMRSHNTSAHFASVDQTKVWSLSLTRSVTINVPRPSGSSWSVSFAITSDMMRDDSSHFLVRPQCQHDENSNTQCHGIQTDQIQRFRRR